MAEVDFREYRSPVAEQWTLLTNHGRVLLIIAADADVRLRDVADSVGITERSVQMIIADLEGAGFISRERRGRRNHYVVHSSKHFRHPNEADHRVGELLDLFTDDRTARAGQKQSS